MLLSDLRVKAKLLKISLVSVSLATFFALLFLLFSSTALAATLYISPSANQYSVGQEFTEKVMVDSGGQSINAVSGTISFYPSTAKIVSISEASSIVNFWAVQPAFSNVDGTINFEGVVLNPGFSGSAGNIVTLTFIAEAPGQNPLKFTAGSILANDGQGTNILSSMNGAVISTVASGNQSGVSSVSSVNPLTPPAPEITSISNPNPDGWAASSSPDFSWVISPDVTNVRLLYDENPTSLPSVVYNPPISTKTLTNVPPGTYYLHVQLKNQYGWGGISHYRFQIDTAPPDPFDISFPDGATSTSAIEVVAFKANDSLSGIDHYSIQTDNQKRFDVSPSDAGSSYTLPSESFGEHSLIVTAYDIAGNYTIATANFFINVVAVLTPADRLISLGALIVNYASLGLVAVLVLALLIGLFLRIIKKVSTLKKKVRKEVSQAEDILHRSFDLLKEDVNEHIRLLLKAETKRALTKEEEIFLRKFGSNLTEAERIIANEIRNLDNLK